MKIVPTRKLFFTVSRTFYVHDRGKLNRYFKPSHDDFLTPTKYLCASTLTGYKHTVVTRDKRKIQPRQTSSCNERNVHFQFICVFAGMSFTDIYSGDSAGFNYTETDSIL